MSVSLPEWMMRSWVCWLNPKVWPLKLKLLSSTFLWYCLLCCTKWFWLESVDEIPKCDHSNESSWSFLSCGTVFYAVQGGSNFWVCRRNPLVWPFKWSPFGITFTWYYCLLTFSKNEISLDTFRTAMDIISASSIYARPPVVACKHLWGLWKAQQTVNIG